MIAIGTMHKVEKIAADGTRQVRDVVELGITLDERVADGFYFGRSLKIVQHLMSHPELLDRPLKEAIDRWEKSNDTEEKRDLLAAIGEIGVDVHNRNRQLGIL